MTTAFARELIGDRAALEARHPGSFRGPGVSTYLTALTTAALVALIVIAVYVLDFRWKAYTDGLTKLGQFATAMFPPDYTNAERLEGYFRSMAETVAIALLGTLTAATIALPLAFFGARNVFPIWTARFFVRRGFDTIRGIDQLIWALIWINVVGLGAFAGVLAIATSEIGLFGKLFSEAIETADAREMEGIEASGGGPKERVRFGILPQLMPVILSQVLYTFESNTRSATIIGVVGAGGIGFTLYELMKQLELQNITFVIILILITVSAIDWLSQFIRQRLIGGDGN